MSSYTEERGDARGENVVTSPETTTPEASALDLAAHHHLQPGGARRRRDDARRSVDRR